MQRISGGTRERWLSAEMAVGFNAAQEEAKLRTHAMFVLSRYFTRESRHTFPRGVRAVSPTRQNSRKMSARSVRYVSLDFDNTLLLSEASKFSTMREVCSRFEQGLDILSTIHTDSRTAPPGKIVTRFTIFSEFASLLSERGLHSGDETVEALGERLCTEFSQLVQTRLAEADEVPGAAEMLAHLGAQQVPCCINSATPVEPLVQLIDALGWSDHFRGVFGSPGTKVENLWLAARSMNLLPEEVVHVGDGDNDRKAAQEFGCRFIGVSDSPGGPDGKWAGASFTVVSDMQAACAKICEYAGVPGRV